MKVLVAGGTGLLGSAAATALAAAGHDVTIMSRSRPAGSPFGWAWGDVTRPSTLGEAVGAAEVLVDAVQFPGSPMEDPKRGLTFERVDRDGTKALIDAAREAGTRLYIGISGVGAAPDARYHWLRAKHEEEVYIKASGVPFVVFRPSWVYGPHDVSLNRFLGFARFLPFVPVIGDGKTRVSPLFIDDLGVHIAAAATLEAAQGHVFEIGGPGVMTMDDIVRTALQVSGKRRFLFHQPKWLMKAAGGVAQHLPGRPLTPDAVDFVTMDGIADTAALRETFGLPLTPLREGLEIYLGRR